MSKATINKTTGKNYFADHIFTICKRQTIIKTWARYLNRQVTKEDVRMSNKHV